MKSACLPGVRESSSSWPKSSSAREGSHDAARRESPLMRRTMPSAAEPEKCIQKKRHGSGPDVA